MTLYHKSLVDRFNFFTREQQIMMVCNELNRAVKRNKYKDQYQMHLTLALELMDFIIADFEQWTGKYKEVCRAREMIARNWSGTSSNVKVIIRLLLCFLPGTATLRREEMRIET